jgi:hypothetical protein
MLSYFICKRLLSFFGAAGLGVRHAIIPAMRLLALLAAACVVAGCSHRVAHTYARSGINEVQLQQDVRALRSVSGVDDVIPHLDSQGNATIELYLDAKSPESGSERAMQLGYRRVTL